MFNRQFSNKNQTNICLNIPISSATQKGKNAFNGSPWQQLCFIPSALPTATGVTLKTHQVEDDTEILIRYNVWGRGPKFGPVHKFELPTVIADSVPRATRVFSLASVGHVTGHMVSHMVPMARCRPPYWKFFTVNNLATVF